MVNQSLVIRINPESIRDGENRQLLVAAKHYAVMAENRFQKRDTTEKT